jgi:hypothetical protein
MISRGKNQHRIVTPNNYPYIYLIGLRQQSNEFNVDNLDVNEDDSDDVVYFAYEGNDPEAYGNAAVLNHANRNGCYHSLYVFVLTPDLNERKRDRSSKFWPLIPDLNFYMDGHLNFLGEYEYDRTATGNNGKKYFVLNKVNNTVSDARLFFSENNGELTQVDHPRVFFDRLRGIIDTESRIMETFPFTGAEEGEYYRRTSNGFQNVNDAPDSIEYRRAQQRQYIMNRLNQRMRRISNRYLRNNGPFAPETESEKKIVDEAYLYCINVGCGNMLILVTRSYGRTEIFCFDLGVENTPASMRAHRKNIDNCLSHIGNKFGLSEIVFDKLFVTHPHFDHISESNSKYLNDETEVYMGFYANFSSNAYFNLIADTIWKRCKYVSCISKNSDNVVKILHPDRGIAYKAAPRGITTYRTSKINNVSPIICININDKEEVVFTGDIEGQGWRWYLNTSPSKRTVNAYVHSHHGSSNGHAFTHGRSSYECYDLFDPDVEFVSTRDGCLFGSSTLNVDGRISSTANRTDIPADVSFYEYDILNHVTIRMP